MRCDNRGYTNSLFLIRFLILLGPRKMKTSPLSRECEDFCPGVAEGLPQIGSGSVRDNRACRVPVAMASVSCPSQGAHRSWPPLLLFSFTQNSLWLG